MAAAGFNVCIVGRNKSKIDEKLSQIASKYKVKTRAIVFDFSVFCTINEYREKIANQLTDIDISMLYLNAGFLQVGAFKDQTDNDTQSTIACNAL